MLDKVKFTMLVADTRWKTGDEVMRSISISRKQASYIYRAQSSGWENLHFVAIQLLVHCSCHKYARELGKAATQCAGRVHLIIRSLSFHPV